MKKKRILADILLVAGVLAAALIVFLLIPRGGGSTVVVTVDGEEYASLPLDTDAELLIESESGTNLLVISGGTASVVEADCPNQVCVETGAISSEGQLIVCLPHKVVIEIVD
ncbi:MAG: NusG domain II-containing protein [Oscillospiraceae bacterium]|nr:NusG domain II-containing protein [Oscillospiraceae bacterium]